MKRNNKKLITLLLAGTLGVAAAGVATLDKKVASAADVTYALSNVFASSDGVVIDAGTLVDKQTTKFTFDKDSTAVRYRNDLAFAWYEGKNDAKYFNMEFAFADLDFETYAFAIESKSAWATEDEKVTNTVYFANREGVVSVAVLNDGEEFVKEDKPAEGNNPAVEKTPTVTLTTPIAANETVKLSLKKGTEDGEFEVCVNEQNVGSFTNVGSNWSEYLYDDDYEKRMFPLQFIGDVVDVATGETAKTTSIFLKSLNGQSFDNVADGKVTDNAVPVLVVDEELNGFELGDSFSLDYKQIDVLQESLSTETKNYYQFNPTHAAPNYDATISGTGSSLYFMDTVYEENGVKKSVYQESIQGNPAGYEYVSIKFTLGDNAHTGDEKKEYDLSWYANPAAIVSLTQGTETPKTTDFIKLYISEERPTYKLFVKNDVTNKNDIPDQERYDKEIAAYQKLVTKAAKDKYVDEAVNFESMAWLFQDDNGYRNLKFTISYKTPSSDSPKSTSGLTYSKLKLTPTEEGTYEFKVFATDLANNKMEYYNKDGELVEVSTLNVWDIEEIPSFKFTIENQGVKVKEATSASSRKVSKTLDDTYTFSDATVYGAANKGSEFSLYKLTDITDYNEYTGVTYAALKEEADKLIAEKREANETVDYAELYIQAYANKTGIERAKFVAIAEKNDLITVEDEEWESSDNKYEFNATSGSFKVVEEGGYLLLATYWNKELPLERAAAYKVVSVASEADSVEGDSNWLKNNLVSVILFSVAGLMLILIIILLFVKPSNETLEDVDKKAKKDKKNEEKVETTESEE